MQSSKQRKQVIQNPEEEEKAFDGDSVNLYALCKDIKDCPNCSLDDLLRTLMGLELHQPPLERATTTQGSQTSNAQPKGSKNKSAQQRRRLIDNQRRL